MPRKVIVGVAGAGKTSYAMDILERELRNGLRWDQIGFSSFSRSACREAAERAGRLLSEDPDRLQKTGWMKTIHAASFRALGLDPKMLIDHDTVEGKKFLKEACGSDRNGEPGTMAGKLNDALSVWDECRARLTLLVHDSTEIGPPDTQPTQTHTKTHCFSDVSCAQVVMQHDNARQNNGIHCSIGSITEQKNIRLHAIENIKCDSVRYSVISQYNPIEYKELGSGHNQNGMCPNVSNVGQKDTISGIMSRIGKGKTLIQKYERHKKLYGRLDYTDILMLYSGIAADDDLTLRQCYPAGQVPEEVQVWLIDEYQDCSPLLALTAQRLSETCGDVYLLGDRWQSIYGFAGASTDVFRSEEMAAKERGDRIILNRTWRNPDSVIEWGESVLQEDSDYESRKPFGESGEGSAGLLDRAEFDSILPSLAGTDSLIISRAWFSLDPIKRKLDDLAIPFRSCQEEKASRWQCPAKIAFTLVMRELAEGMKISEQDFRRITVELPAKWQGQELFVRGTKSKWKKFECSGEPKRTLMELSEWGATDWFAAFVKNGKWRVDMPLLLDRAIDLYGIEEVRSPSIRLGSVHSIKGLEARNVFCLSDSTEKVAIEGDDQEERCLRYVAITRSSQHYRLVVNQMDISRGRNLFWAAPKGERKYVGFDDFRKKRTKESNQLLQEDADQGQEESSRDLRIDGTGRLDDVHSGTIRRDRDESGRKEADCDATSEPEGYTSEWWDL